MHMRHCTLIPTHQEVRRWPHPGRQPLPLPLSRRRRQQVLSQRQRHGGTGLACTGRGRQGRGRTHTPQKVDLCQDRSYCSCNGRDMNDWQYIRCGHWHSCVRMECKYFPCPCPTCSATRVLLTAPHELCSCTSTTSEEGEKAEARAASASPPWLLLLLESSVSLSLQSEGARRHPAWRHVGQRAPVRP